MSDDTSQSPSPHAPLAQTPAPDSRPPSGVHLFLTINGEPREVLVPPHRTLLEVLRDDLKLKGTKEGCAIGVCGACTVLADGKPIAACLALAVQYEGRSIQTVEGLAQGEALHPVQQAFADGFAFQCGFCTAGFIMATAALLAEQPEADEEQIKDYLLGNFCRCGNYVEILRAVRAAQAALRGGA